MHHIIDPATGAPARTKWRTVSVAAADCAEANIATTAALVRDDTALAWLRGLGLPARLVDWHGRVTTIGGWPSLDSPAGAPGRPAGANGESMASTAVLAQQAAAVGQHPGGRRP
jgi:thiamine biosynthesis lipoprotein